MQLNMRNPLLILCLFMAQLLQAQTPSNPFMVPDIQNHEFHRKCGHGSATEALISNNPDLARQLENFKRDIPEMVRTFQENEEARSSSVATIINVPVVVHVIHTGQPVGTGINISDAQIQAQIDVLNEDFNAENVNFVQTPAQWQAAIGNPEVNFCLAAIDPSGNPTNGITRHNMTVTGTNINNSNIESVIKPATWWDSDLYYNIWVLPIPGTTAGGGTTGYAYYPFNGTIGTSTDGSVVDYRWFGGPGFGQSGDKTLTHETGHYLGLPHTFDDESCGADDGFADTPNIDAPTSDYQPNLNCGPNNFPTGPTSCTNAHMYVNYMDYVNDDYCSTSFSNDQIALMRAVLNGQTTSFGYGSRLPLSTNAVAVCTFYDNDAGVTQIQNPGTFICESGQITPKVVITNFGQNNLNSVTINYQINNNAPVSLVWGTNLATAEKDTVDLAPYTPPGGAYTFTAYTTLPNGVVDEQLINDTLAIQTLAISPLPIPLVEGFENSAFNPTVNGLFVFDISNDGVTWERSTAASGFGNGTASAMFDNYNNGGIPLGTIDALITPIYDFSTVTGAQATFDVGYAYYDDGNQVLTDTLIVLISTNCGTNYIQQIYVKGGAELSTAPPTVGPFTPNATQWRTETIDLSAFDGEDNVSIMFVNYYGYGNRLFIDNINISLPCALVLSENHVDVDCFGDCTGSAIVNPTGGSGAYTYQWDANAGNATTQSVNNLCAGDYFVTVSEGANCSEVLAVTISEFPQLTTTISGTNETAVGANDGTATANPSGGNNNNTIPYTYEWSNTETTQTIANLAPGTYIVTVTDGSGCTLVETIVIEPYDCGSYAISVTGTNVLCFGDDNGTVTASVNAGTGTAPFTYNWSNAAGNIDMITGLGPDTYFVTVTDDKGCTATGSYEVVEPAALSVSVTTTDETAAGANDGTATVIPTGGTPSVTILWSNAGNTGMINNLSPGTYSVTATDAAGCMAVSSGIVNPGAVDCSGFSIGIQSVGTVSCNGACDANINLTINSTATPFTFDWSDDALDGQQNPANLCAGTYSVTVTDNDGCSATLTETITEPVALQVDWLASNINCFEACTGMIQADGLGGTAPYVVDISGGSFINLCAGFYDVTVTDTNGCTAAANIEVTEFGPDQIDATVSMPACFGSCDGSIAVSAINNDPYTFAWSNGGSGNIQNNLCAGTYNITVTNAQGCSTVLTETVTESPELVLSVSATQITTAGANDATATASASGGSPTYTYLWQPNGENTPTIAPLAAGTYTVVVTDAMGCTATETVVINPFDCAGFIANITATTDISCAGVCDASINTNVSGGAAPFTYTWSDASLNGQANPTGLCAGTYTVTISESNGCSAILNSTLTEPAPLMINTSTTAPTSAGANDGTAGVIATGGTTDYEYLWSPTGETTPIITNLAPGTYTVLVTDMNGCTANSSVIIQDIDCSSFMANISVTNVLCFDGSDGSATATPTGGTMPYTIIWGTGSIGTTLNNLIAGTYDVLVTDALGCSFTENFEVTQPPLLSVTVTGTDETTAGANDGTAQAAVAGGTMGYTYEWCNGAITENVTNLPPGACGVTVTDANGCTDMVTVIIGTGGVDCTNFSATIATEDVTCFGDADGNANTVVSGGTMPISYQWSNGAITPNIQNVISDNYLVTITDANGCETIVSGLVGTPDAMLVGLTTTDETAAGANDGTAMATVSGGTPNYTYAWCNGTMGSNVTGLPAGLCSVTVTDANGCTQSESFVIAPGGVDCSDFAASAFSEDVNCFDGADGSVGTVVTGGTMPIVYQWSNGAVTSSIPNVISDNYTVTITDANGCQTIVSAFVGSPDAMVVNNTSTNETSAGANDGTATATVTGGTAPWTYLWCDGQTGNPATGLAAGTCGVTITDFNGCTATSSVVIGTTGIDCSTFSGSATATDITCATLTDGSASAIANGGTTPYSFNWSTGSTVQNIDNLAAGNYTVTITDANGCEEIATVMVIEPTPVTYTIAITPETSLGASDATADLIPTGGNAPYTIVWCDGQTGEMATNLASGFCQVIVTDANGCSVSEILFFPEGPMDCSGFSTAVITEVVSCFGEEDGTATAITTGGAAPFDFVWNTGATTATITALEAGNYTVTVVDANDCEVVQSGIVAQPQELVYNITSTLETAPGANDGTATANPSGGITPYTYLWCNGQTTMTATNLPGGFCMVTITDDIGCSQTGEVFIETIPSDCSGFGMFTTTESTSCFGGADGFATANVSGGLAPYTYIWSNGGNTPTISNLPAGPYDVTVIDGLGCEIVEQGVVVSQPFQIVLQTTPYDGNCGGDAAALVTTTGGAPPYTYLWNNGMTDILIDGLTTGLYEVTVTDANGCTNSETVVVQVNSSAVSVDSDVNPVSCFGDADGDIDLTVTSGTPPFSFVWTTGATSEDLFNMPAGSYSVLITDAAGCLFGSTYDIDAPASLSVGFLTSPADNGANGSATALAIGGTGPYFYNWNGPQTATISGLVTGTYSVTITDANGCTAAGSITIGTTATDDIESLVSFNVFPNPTDGAFGITAQFSKSEEAEIIVYNVLGQVVFYQESRGLDLTIPIDIRQQATGTYMVVLKTEDGLVVRKVVKN